MLKQGLPHECNVDIQESSRENMMVDAWFPPLLTVVEPRLLHGPYVLEQGLPHQVSTVKYGSLPSAVFGIVDEDSQCLWVSA